jgi:uncharacterized membrane protein YbaN (DUF454 family)
VLKTFYIFVGVVAVGLGIVGIVVPGLPTTPFLLLSSWLFYKSSRRLHDALHCSPCLGLYLRRWEERRGVGWKSKALSILCMWAMIMLCAFVVMERWPVRFLLLGLGVVGTCCVLFVVPNVKRGK